MSNTVGVPEETRTIYQSPSPILLLLMSPFFIRGSYINSTMSVLVGTRTTYHSQAPRLLLLMSPFFIRGNYMTNKMWVPQKKHGLLTIHKHLDYYY